MAISITNEGKRDCEAAVDWYDGGTILTCTTLSLLAPGEMNTHCSRFDGTMATCIATCAPQIFFGEGNAIVTTSKSCGKITVDAKQYYISPNDISIQGVTHITVTRIGKGNTGD